MRIRYLIWLTGGGSVEELQEDVELAMADASDDPSAGPVVQVKMQRVYHVEDRRLITVECTSDGDDELVPSAIEAVETALGAADGSNHLVKVFDSRTYEENERIARQLFDVESGIREALTTLLLVLMPDADIENLLGISRVRANNDMPGREELQKRFENDLWYLSFSDYKVIGDVKLPANVADLIKLLHSADDFGDFQRAIAAELPLTAPGPEFLANLREPLESLEKARNAVAHNRALSAKARQNFERALPLLMAAIDDFHRRIEQDGSESQIA